ncbi:MAG: hypothetical protein R3213_02750 [Flavobacteriaceae bacterium]|nr:hypothetical protein [Flavobacteriaceae bacterium]
MYNLLRFKGILILTLILIFQSCSDDDSNSTEVLSQEERSNLRMNHQIDQAEWNLANFVIGLYVANEANDFGRLASQNNTVPDCATLTVVMEQNYRELTLDFGDGCSVNGNTYTGKLIIDYIRDTSAQNVLINYELVDFYFNQIGLEGNLSILFNRSNSNGNLQFTNNLSLDILWPDGAQASRSGQKIMEQIAGADTVDITDNVFLITGFWLSTFRNGNTHSYEVLDALRREVSCAYIVAGTVAVERTNFSGILDFGMGNCDNRATFTLVTGETINIELN